MVLRILRRARRPENVATYIRHKTDLLDFSGIDPRGASVLDAGAGFGLTLVVLAALGAKRAQGIEFHEPMVRTARARICHCCPLGSSLGSRSTTETSWPCRTPDKSFDAVLSVEAISHYRDVEAAVSEIHRVLRPGGIAAISDGNNGLNPLTRRRTRQVWDAFELGAASGEVHGHVVTHNYQAEREQYISERFPLVPSERMSRETFGMTFSEIGEAGSLYEREKVFPGSTYDGAEVPVNPADGQVIERTFDPYLLGKRLAQLGFDVRVSGHWAGANGRRVLRVANGLLSRMSRLTIYSARGFVIAAKKT